MTHNNLCQATAATDAIIAAGYVLLGIMYVHLRYTIGAFKIVFPARETLP